MKYTTTVARLQRHHHHASDNFFKHIFNLFSEKDLLCILQPDFRKCWDVF